MPREGNRGRLRSHEACLNCRKKKTRCPAEKPACSSCVRLNQECVYTPVLRGSHCDPSADRLAYLEGKVNQILSGDRVPSQERSYGGANDAPDTAYSTSCPSTGDIGRFLNDPILAGMSGDESSIGASLRFSQAVEFYFQYCHRQPIWCFDREEVKDPSSVSEELVCSILTLTARFSQDRDEMQYYCDTARTLVMLRIANGSVGLETLESLCLLSYSFFLDGDLPLGRFHVGLALQLCRSAMLDVGSTSGVECSSAERKRRLFWSLQLLEQSYGQTNSILSVPADVLRPFCILTGDNRGQQNLESNLPALPTDNMGCKDPSDIGIWSLTFHFGWVWSRVRSYVFDCAQSRLKEPWRHDSMYSMILSDLMELENKLSLCHRYESVKFFERRADELRIHREYWAPWLKLQFTYHSILTLLNHPFVYIVASQYNRNLTIPNTFWRRSSELVLLHATWIVRMIDMVSDKKMRLIDPFFGHAASIAATVHLYYCCAADPRLKFKSKTDFAKCRQFLKGFVTFSSVCGYLDQTLDKLTRIAAGSEKVDYEWEPSKIHLSIPLMWDLFQINCTTNPRNMSTAGLLHPSLTPGTFPEDAEDSSSTLEIIVAMSPQVTVDTADGGSAAHLPPNVPGVTSASLSPGIPSLDDKLVAPADSLMANTPWLWTDPSQFVELESIGLSDSEAALGNIEGFSTWWDFGNL